jgi:hypothetical protein
MKTSLLPPEVAIKAKEYVEKADRIMHFDVKKNEAITFFQYLMSQNLSAKQKVELKAIKTNLHQKNVYQFLVGAFLDSPNLFSFFDSEFTSDDVVEIIGEVDSEGKSLFNYTRPRLIQTLCKKFQVPAEKIRPLFIQANQPSEEGITQIHTYMDDLTNQAEYLQSIVQFKVSTKDFFSFLILKERSKRRTAFDEILRPPYLIPVVEVLKKIGTSPEQMFEFFVLLSHADKDVFSSSKPCYGFLYCLEQYGRGVLSSPDKPYINEAEDLKSCYSELSGINLEDMSVALRYKACFRSILNFASKARKFRLGITNDFSSMDRQLKTDISSTSQSRRLSKSLQTDGRSICLI